MIANTLAILSFGACVTSAQISDVTPA